MDDDEEDEEDIADDDLEEVESNPVVEPLLKDEGEVVEEHLRKRPKPSSD